MRGKIFCSESGFNECSLANIVDSMNAGRNKLDKAAHFKTNILRKSSMRFCNHSVKFLLISFPVGIRQILRHHGSYLLLVSIFNVFRSSYPVVGTLQHIYRSIHHLTFTNSTYVHTAGTVSDHDGLTYAFSVTILC